MNCVPLSLISTLETPKQGKMILLNILVTTLGSSVGLAMASTHLEIVPSNQNVLVNFGGRKRPHEVNAPNVKNLNFKDVVERHLILPRYIAHPQAMIT